MAFMVEEFGYGGKQLGIYAGLLAATFCAAQFCSSLAWGQISDKYGRKPAIVIGTFGAGLGMLIFGCSGCYAQAVLGRAVSGILSGNLGVVKCFLTEITNKDNRGDAFSYMQLGGSIGAVLGPLLGGLLCKPAEKFPGMFSAHSVFRTRPYLLPCLICVCLNFTVAILCALFMRESRVFAAVADRTTQPSMSVISHVADTDTDTDGLELLPVSSDSAASRSDAKSGTGDDQGCTRAEEVEEDSPNPNEEDRVAFTVNSLVRCLVLGSLAYGSPTTRDSIKSTAYSPLPLVESESESGPTAVASPVSIVRAETPSPDPDRDLEKLTVGGGLTGTTLPVLQQETVVMVTLNYGLLGMATVLCDETIPLMLKLDADQGGFSFQITQIGVLLSSAGVVMIFFTLLVLPWFTRQSKRWMNRFGTLCNVPLSLLWPVVAVINHQYELSHGHQSFPLLWPCLIGIYILKNIMVNVAFTGMIIQVNHSVFSEDLGKVNGLGQSFVSAARALGPALGGCLWSLSIHTHFVFLNFILVAALYILSERLNGSLPARLDQQKTRTV